MLEYNPINPKRLNKSQRDYLADLFGRIKPAIAELGGKVSVQDFDLRDRFPTEGWHNLQACLDLAIVRGEARIATETVVVKANGSKVRGLPIVALV